MHYSSLTSRMQNDGAGAWQVHQEAVAARQRGEDVIVLSVGDPDFDTPPPVIDSAVEALRRGDTHYPAIAGRSPLRKAIADSFTRRTGITHDEQNVVVCSGTQNALLAAALCVLDHGDEVIGLDPMYVTYESTLRLGGADLVRVAQPAACGFRPDVESIADAVTPRTRALVVTTPNNPTGVVLSESELSAIAEIARSNDLWVIADEVYADLVFDGTHVSISSLPEMAERTLTVSSLSKSHAMTGWRCGWVIGPHDAMQHIDNLQTNVNYGVPGFVQQAALTALTECDGNVAHMRNAYRRRRDLAYDQLARTRGLDVLLPQAGMYLMANVGPLSSSTADFVRALFDETGVSVLDGATFGAAARGWVRISFATDDESVVEGCRRLTEFLSR